MRYKPFKSVVTIAAEFTIGVKTIDDGREKKSDSDSPPNSSLVMKEIVVDCKGFANLLNSCYSYDYPSCYFPINTRTFQLSTNILAFLNPLSFQQSSQGTSRICCRKATIKRPAHRSRSLRRGQHLWLLFVSPVLLFPMHFFVLWILALFSHSMLKLRFL